ncbi:SCO1860 family LAETG-anchored protein [Streptomyces sp. SBT349]|uniref:SCO1860 family LAETG-anchored protein n=1 Tax=Streptomyces sp. SBT349 TaxID=1580539 RepID=UPI00066ADC7B|nr:SCO1860 family LAETG-anchored protein [Streptomyces sp. SBT349]
MKKSVCRRAAASLLACAALLAPAVSAAPAAHADEPAPGGAGAEGTASAAVLRAGLDVSLLDGATGLPLDVALNEVSAPAGSRTASETLLTASLDGLDGGRPFEMLRADVADATATADAEASSAEASLVNARVHVPGLPLLAVVELDAVAARARCVPGEAPVAETDMPAAATVLGREVDLTADGTFTVPVPGVGEVTLDLSRRETSDGAAAASALDLRVAVNPLNLGVAGVTGTVTLAEVSCQEPAASPRTQTVTEETEEAPEMARTGGGSLSPYVIGGALGLLAAGTAALVVARQRRTA